MCSMKNHLLVLILFLSAPIFLLAGCYGLSKHIYSRMDCKAFNIDNIEVRTGVNIPAVVSSECEIEQAEKRKMSRFTIDASRVKVKDYIARNNFMQEGDLYTISGENDETQWSAVLDPETNELSFKILYR